MEIKAKTTSLIGMIIGAAGLSAMAIIILIKFCTDSDFNIPTLAEVGSLILISCSPAIPFCPVFINMFFDKIKEIKSLKAGGTENEIK